VSIEPTNTHRLDYLTLDSETGQRKDEERTVRTEARREEKLRKEAEKAAKAEERRHTKEEKGKSEETSTGRARGAETHKVPGEQQEVPGTKSASPRSRLQSKPKEPKESRGKGKEKDSDPTKSTSPEKSPKSEADATSPTSKMRDWLKARFGRPRAKSSPSTGDPVDVDPKDFIGGTALNRLRDGSASTNSIEVRSASMREVALAGKAVAIPGDEPGESSTAREREAYDWHGNGGGDDNRGGGAGRDGAVSPMRSVDSVSPDSEDQVFVEVEDPMDVISRREYAGRQSPPRKPAHLARDSRFHELM
jgi:hypothetical protein